MTPPSSLLSPGFVMCLLPGGAASLLERDGRPPDSWIFRSRRLQSSLKGFDRRLAGTLASLPVIPRTLTVFPLQFATHTTPKINSLSSV